MLSIVHRNGAAVIVHRSPVGAELVTVPGSGAGILTNSAPGSKIWWLVPSVVTYKGQLRRLFGGLRKRSPYITNAFRESMFSHIFLLTLPHVTDTLHEYKVKECVYG
jgi:hypothetical protein